MAPIILVSFEDSFEIEEILIRSFGGFRFTSLRVTWLRRPRCTWSILLLTTATRTTLGQNGGTSWWTGNSPGRWWCKQTLLSEVRFRHLKISTWNIQSRAHVSFNLTICTWYFRREAWVVDLRSFSRGYDGLVEGKVQPWGTQADRQHPPCKLFVLNTQDFLFNEGDP